MLEGGDGKRLTIKLPRLVQCNQHLLSPPVMWIVRVPSPHKFGFFQHYGCLLVGPSLGLLKLHHAATHLGRNRLSDNALSEFNLGSRRIEHDSFCETFQMYVSGMTRITEHTLSTLANSNYRSGQIERVLCPGGAIERFLPSILVDVYMERKIVMRMEHWSLLCSPTARDRTTAFSCRTWGEYRQ